MIISTKALKFETICQMTRELRRRGLRIGFTHGAYDLFHMGHLSFLRQTAKKCDFLVVALGCDTNIRKYKNYARPIIGEQQRLEIISEQKSVGAAFVNKWGIDDVWTDLGRELKPDVLFIGGEYGMSSEKLRREADKMKVKLERTRHEFENTTDIIKRIVKTQAKFYPN